MPKAKDDVDPKGKKISKKKVKKKSSSDLKELNVELNELKDKHLRLKAEFENFRRRKSDEISNILRFDGENIISEFLPILDDIERMISSTDGEKDSLSEGMSLVKNKINKFFENLDIKPFGDVNEKMNPEIHDAMLTQKVDNLDENVIISVFEKGYTYRDKVIRHAKVIVNKK